MLKRNSFSSYGGKLNQDRYKDFVVMTDQPITPHEIIQYLDAILVDRLLELLNDPETNNQTKIRQIKDALKWPTNP